MKKSRKIIISVGTSILNMKQKDIKSLSREYLSGLKISCNDILYSKEIPNEEINDYLQKSVKCICDKLSRNEEIAAELDTIKSIDRRISEDDEIVLFVTDTIDGSLSARILMDSIRIFWNSSVRCQIIEGLSVEKNDNQIQEGCIQLLRKVVHEVKDDPENTSVVITGGYKFMIAYMNLGALLYGAEVIYIYEGSKKPIYLPKVNLMPNLSIWNEYFDIFHELERNGKLEKSDYRNVINMSRHNQGKIHSDMNPFIEKIDGKKYITLNPIGEVLHKRAFEMYKDNLTGLFDRSFFDLALKPWMSRIDPKQCGILITDIDEFKSVNDDYGHDAGDKVLRKFAEIFSEIAKNQSSWPKCWPLRWGGEEFLLLCPERNREETFELAEVIRKAVENQMFEVNESKKIKVTVTCGVAHWPYCMPEGSRLCDDFMKLFKKADEALYKGKNTGKNRTCEATRD